MNAHPALCSPKNDLAACDLEAVGELCRAAIRLAAAAQVAPSPALDQARALAAFAQQPLASDLPAPRLLEFAAQILEASEAMAERDGNEIARWQCEFGSALATCARSLLFN